jgi:glycosyltransferase involved in cell wall biosynthesis
LLADLAAESQGARNVHVVPHGIDFTAAAGVENAVHIRRRFGIPADAFVFLSVQQLYPGKTPVNAVRAFSHATSDRRHAFMLIAGDGPGRAAVERIAQETGSADRVVLAGAIPPAEIATYMRASDAFVIDTAFESFGTSAVEAMAAGLPVIGTRSGALPEMVEDGRTGLLSRFGDVASMANDMRRVMTNPELRDHLRAEARRSAASFDWSSIAEQYTAGYGVA